MCLWQKDMPDNSHSCVGASSMMLELCGLWPKHLGKFVKLLEIGWDWASNKT